MDSDCPELLQFERQKLLLKLKNKNCPRRPIMVMFLFAIVTITNTIEETRTTTTIKARKLPKRIPNIAKMIHHQLDLIAECRGCRAAKQSSVGFAAKDSRLVS